MPVLYWPPAQNSSTSACVIVEAESAQGLSNQTTKRPVMKKAVNRGEAPASSPKHEHVFASQ